MTNILFALKRKDVGDDLKAFIKDLAAEL